MLANWCCKSFAFPSDITFHSSPMRTHQSVGNVESNHIRICSLGIKLELNIGFLANQEMESILKLFHLSVASAE